MSIQIKICGIGSHEALETAAEAGASHIGLMFYPPSPRAVAVELAAELADAAPQGVKRVGVFVDPDDALLEATLAAVSLDLVQLHGREAQARVDAVRQTFGKPVIKAVPIADPDDVAAAHGYEEVADFLLFDAKPPKSMPRSLPGGTGLTFDWRLIAGETWGVPWILAGGLTPENVAEAIARTGARFVDVSSGVERSPGVKDPKKIKAFIEAARSA